MADSTQNGQLNVGHLIREHGKQLGFKSPPPGYHVLKVSRELGFIGLNCVQCSYFTGYKLEPLNCLLHSGYFPKFQLHLFPSQGFTSFPKIKELPQNSGHQSSELEQRCWGHTGIRPHHEKLVCFVTLRLGFMHHYLEW